MELNSRDFCSRVRQIDRNAEALCDYLKSSSCNHLITDVLYPKWQNRENYDLCRSKHPTRGDGGFGGLFTLLFVSPEVAHAFFDALRCAKDASLGTNFTLACPYALYAYWYEADWAKEHGVPQELVRVSAGTEDIAYLMEMFADALRVAEACLPSLPPVSSDTGTSCSS